MDRAAGRPSASAASSTPRENIQRLLGYAEEILKAGEKVVCDLARDALASFHEADVAGLDGVTIPSEDGDGTWLSVARLHETAPPMPPDEYQAWLVLTSRGGGPFDPPGLREALSVRVSPEEASDLVEAGLASQDDVTEPDEGDTKAIGAVAVLLRLEHLTEFVGVFEAWVAGPWANWERTERRRRRSIALYNKLFEYQQRMSSMGEDTPIEVVFGVGLARWSHPEGRIDAPLIEATVEIDLAEDGSVVVRPRAQAPRVTLGPFVELELPGVPRLQQEAAAQLERFCEDPNVGFWPHDPATFGQVLRMCHARLASDAVYEPEHREPGDREPPRADAKLRITDGWVLYVRPRSADFRCEDIRRLKKAVEEAGDAELPPPALRMTSRPSDERLDTGGVVLGPVGAPSAPAAGAVDRGREADRTTFLFPLPCNDDQKEIVRRLENDDVEGVVVQGPPGTGKTHTIANIVAHYMANGRRVLVCAHQAEALSAIRGRLPESIRDLAISVIHSDREGARELEQAVEVLSSQVKSVDLQAYDARRSDLEAELVRIGDEIVATDEAIQDHARLNLDAVTFRGQKLRPMELAAAVITERTEHAWFPDRLGMAPRFDPLFGDVDVAEAGRMRRTLGADLVYPLDSIPDPATLPDVPRLLAAHAKLHEEGRSDALTHAGDLPHVSLGPEAGPNEARQVRAWLDEAAAWLDETAAVGGAAWLVDVYRIVVGASQVHESVRSGVTALCVEWSMLCVDARPFALRGVTLPDSAGVEEAFDAALAALAEGRKPFGILSMGKTAARLKEMLAAVTVDGAVPTERQGWTVAREKRGWDRRARALAGKWSAAAAALGLPPLRDDSPETDLIRLGALIERMHELQADAARHERLLAVLFPFGIDSRKVAFHLEVALPRAALAAALDKEGNADARRVRRALEEAASAGRLPFHVALGELASALGGPDLTVRKLADAWREMVDEAARLNGLRESRRRLEAFARRVAESGARRWAAALLSEIATDDDPWTPSEWRKTWEWARADAHVRMLSDRGALASLTAKRARLENSRREKMDELVRVRTFIGLRLNITQRVASALQKFAMKVRQLGAGTGKSAERHRRAIREATLEAAAAVPCWILPEWRVAEQLPSELARFDLVIIDEASQSDVTALPAVMRGKKLLVVGDDKQVSPSAVGMEERKVVQLRETWLRGMDLANFLEPTTSLYDLASMTFPGTVIMLREHFRCVEPIISFSRRFYNGGLVPLRVPTAVERIDPPLVDVYLPEGRRVRDVNEAEVAFIVGEIGRLVAHPAYARRTIGVISMIADKQAKRILDRLVAEVGTEAIVRHRIMCGNASAFQGQERDVMFLSLVACPRSARAQTARLMEQRFNVAMSRARDRMYLVRSVAASQLNPNDLKAAVIEHFRSPMAHALTPTETDVLEEAESGFEREVGGLLLDRGYRLRAQVPVGGYRIDFVVEGAGDRRLAVELDGDRWHGPERWFADILRQRTLERIGWTFWRCWGSHWLADREACLGDLLSTLARLGIEPLGGEPAQQVWTEHRVIGGDAPAVPSVVDAPREAVVDDAMPVRTDADDPAERLVAANLPAEPSGDVVEFGDVVIVRFADDNRVRRIRLNDAAHDPDRGEIGPNQPIAQALLGLGIEEETEMEVGGRRRRVIVEKISKAA
jgi:very-short-patch-repair endonuclease